jgi:hypothetical protein
MTTLRTRRTYDHRIREMICETGNPDLFRELKIPRSTIRSWLHRGIPDVVTWDPLSAERPSFWPSCRHCVIERLCSGRSSACWSQCFAYWSANWSTGGFPKAMGNDLSRICSPV